MIQGSRVHINSSQPLLIAGFGDFSPKTPGGRVFFVIYAFSAVPLVASFAVQAVTGLLSTYFTSQAARYARHHSGQTLPPLDAFRSHQYFVMKQRDLILELGRTATIDDKDHALPRAELSDDEVTAVTRDSAAAIGINVDSSSEEGPLETWGMAQERVLTQELIECTMIMESIARRLIVESLPRNTIGRTLLEADHNLQCRNVQAAGGDTNILSDLGNSKLGTQPKVNTTEQPYEGASQLEQIRQYREMFARILATGSALQRLEGEERYRFERVMIEERARARSAG
jgi:potassium channel subfamily K